MDGFDGDAVGREVDFVDVFRGHDAVGWFGNAMSLSAASEAALSTDCESPDAACGQRVGTDAP